MTQGVDARNFFIGRNNVEVSLCDETDGPETDQYHHPEIVADKLTYVVG